MMDNFRSVLLANKEIYQAILALYLPFSSDTDTSAHHQAILSIAIVEGVILALSFVGLTVALIILKSKLTRKGERLLIFLLPYLFM